MEKDLYKSRIFKLESMISSENILKNNGEKELRIKIWN